MMWEMKKHTWGELTAAVSAAFVPEAIARLVTSATEEEAWEAAELIDNNVVVQGWLFGAAPATAACLVIALPVCPRHCRITILELLGHLCGPTLAPEGSEQYLLQLKSVAEVRKGLAVYLSLLEAGSLEECYRCIGLLDICALCDSSLVEQVVYYLARVKERFPDAHLHRLSDNTVELLLKQAAPYASYEGS